MFVNGGEYSGVDMTLKEGCLYFSKKYEEPWGVAYYRSYFGNKNVDAMDLTNVPLEVLLSLPGNIKTIYVGDLNDLTRVSTWITGERINHHQSGMTLEYIGRHTNHIPVVDTVGEHITRLHIPLVQSPSDIVRLNTHLLSVGVDLDKYHHPLPPNIPLVIWSSNEHRIKHIRSCCKILSSTHHQSQ